MNRAQRIKINKNVSDKTDTDFGILQGSVLGPLLFNINLIDLFYERKDSNVASYADDTIPYSCAADIASVALELLTSATKLFHWFKNSHLKANQGKSHILLSTKKTWDCFRGQNSSCRSFLRKITRSCNRLRTKVWESHYKDMSQS